MSPPLNEAQATRVERHTGMVREIARKVARSVGERLLTFEELESVGNEALVQAALRYDPNHTASFATFAHYRVYGAMIDALRQRTPGRRSYRRALVQLGVTQDLLHSAAEDHGSLRAAGVQPSITARVDMAREVIRRATVAAQLCEAQDRFDEVADQHPNPEQRLLDAEPRRRLWEIVGQLDSDDRELIDAIYVRGQTMREFAEATGSTPSTISRRHARVVDRLAKRAASLSRSDR